MELSCNKKRVFYIILLILWLVSPGISLLPVFIYLFIVKNKNKYEVYFLLFLISLTMGLISYTQKPINKVDIIRYYSDYRLFASLFFKDGIVAIFSRINILFNLINFLLTRLFPATPQLLSLFWVTVIYYFYFLSFLLLKDETNDSKLYIFIIISILGIMHFTSAVEIIKQMAAMSVFLFSLAGKYKEQKYSFLWLAASVFIHFSALLFVPLYFLVKNINFKYIHYFIPICFIIGVLINFNYLVYILTDKIPFLDYINRKAIDYIALESKQIKYYNILDFLTYVIILIPLIIKKHSEDYIRNTGIYVLCLFLLNLNNAHNFLRFLAGIRVFFGLIFYDLLYLAFDSAYIKKIVLAGSVMSFIILNILYLYNRVSYLSIMGNINEYHSIFLNGSIFNFFFYNLFDFISCKI